MSRFPAETRPFRLRPGSRRSPGCDRLDHDASRQSRRRRPGLDAILTTCPELAAVTVSVPAFTAIDERAPRELLEPWMASGLAPRRAPALSIVTGPRADQNALPQPSNSGAVEDYGNRKMRKRQMYGRANPICSAVADSSPTN